MSSEIELMGPLGEARLRISDGGNGINFTVSEDQGRSASFSLTDRGDAETLLRQLQDMTVRKWPG